MVRLRPANRPGTWMLSTFQFHYGAIKTTLPATKVYISPAFQFHYGAIKTYISPAGIALNVEFQFHYGAIKTISRLARLRPITVSIPIWCD